jgi:hypothetical protein
MMKARHGKNCDILAMVIMKYPCLGEVFNKYSILIEVINEYGALSKRSSSMKAS